MPSGSKKRKAAKKKKENQPSNSHPDSSSYASAQSQGSDDVKHQDDKESDDAGSPVSDDHHPSLLARGEDNLIVGGNNVPNPLPEEGVKIEGVDETNVAVEEEDDSAKRDGRFDETTMRLDHGGSSGSSSSSRSSSDDESHGTKSHEVAEIIAPVVESVTTADSSYGGTNVVAIDEARDSAVENIPVVLETISSLHQSEVEDMRSPAKNSAAPSLVNPAFEESEEKVLSSLEDKADISTACKDAESETKVEATILAVEKLATYSDPKVCVSQTTDDQLITSYNAPIAATENGADHEGDSGINEPLLRPSPHQVQTTSWKSCCGLFEVFAGSNR